MISRWISLARLLNVVRVPMESKVVILILEFGVDGSYLVFVMMTEVCGWKATWKLAL
jgi:hypothetical protein